MVNEVFTEEVAPSQDLNNALKLARLTCSESEWTTWELGCKEDRSGEGGNVGRASWMGRLGMGDDDILIPC